MRRSLFIMAVLLCAVLAAAGAGAAKGRSHVYRFDGIVKGTDVVLADVKGDGPSPGDVYTFKVTAYDKSGKHKRGSGHGYCVLGAPTFSTCTSITHDGKGSIVLAWEDDGKASTPQHVAITGGTQRYRYIRGDGTSTQPKASDPFTFRVKLRGRL